MLNNALNNNFIFGIYYVNNIISNKLELYTK